MAKSQQEAEQKLIDQGGKWIKEHQRWGHCPTYRMPDGTLRFVDAMLVENEHGYCATYLALSGPQMYALLEETWRPQSREDQDWMVANLEGLKDK